MTFAAPPIPEVEIIADIARAFEKNPDNPIELVHVQFGESANFTEYKAELDAGKIVYLIQGPIIDPDEPVMKDTRGNYISGTYFAWVCGGNEKKLIEANAVWHKTLFQTEDAGLGRRAHYPIDFPDSNVGSIRFLAYFIVGALQAKTRRSEGGAYYVVEQLIEFTALKIK